MALLHADSFEADRTLTSLSRRYIATGFPATISDNGGRQPGTKALTFLGTDGSSAILNAAGNVPFNDYVLVGFGFRAQRPQTEQFFRIRKSGAKQCWLAIEDTDATGYRISFYSGDATRIYQSEKTAEDVWRYIELEAFISPVSILGEYTLKIDGLVVARGSTNLAETASPGWDSLHWTFNPDETEPGSYVSIDDFYAQDEAPGYARRRFFGPGVRIEALRPLAAGLRADWDVTGAGTNYDAVDDAGAGTPTVDDDTTYVSTADDTALDLYTFTKPKTAQQAVLGIDIEEDVRHEGAADEIRPVAFRDGVATEVSRRDIPGNTYSRERFLSETDPLDSSRALTHERLSATQWGHGDPSAVTSKPDSLNVIVLVIDDPTFDAMSVYDAVHPYRQDWTAGQGQQSGAGDDPFTSGLYVQDTFLQHLAGEGVLFLDCSANPTCSPSRACMLTGRYSFSTGVGAVIRNDLCTIGSFYEFGDFPVVTLAEVLNAAGKTTAMVGKWHLALDLAEDTVPPSGFSGSGFQHVDDVGQWGTWYCGHFRNLNQTPAPSGSSSLRGYYHWRISRNGTTQDYTDPSSQGHTNPAVKPNYATTVQFDDALTLANSIQEPFLLVVNTNAVHGPFQQAPPELVVTSAYKDVAWPGVGWKNAQGMLEAWNTKAWQLYEGLDSSRKNKTVWIVIGDNSSDAAIIQSLDSVFDMGPTYDELISLGRFKGQVYERGVATPLIIAGPVIEDPGRTSEAMAHVVDLFPTVLDIMGVAYDPLTLHGISLMPVLRNAVNHLGHARQHVFVEAFMPNGTPLDTYTFPPEWSSASVSYTLGQNVRWLEAEYDCIQAHTSNASREPGTTGGNAYWSFLRGLRLDRAIKARLSGFTSPTDGTANGIFKLVRNRPNADELYLLVKESGQRWDPYELNPLSLTTYAAQLAALIAMLDDLISGGGSGTLRLVVADDSTGLELRCALNEADQLDAQDDTTLASLLIQSASNQIECLVDGSTPLQIALEGAPSGSYAMEATLDETLAVLECALDGSDRLDVTLDEGGSLLVSSASGQIIATDDSTGSSLAINLVPV